MRERLEEVLKRVRPVLQADGGDVELVDAQDGVVKVKLTGACLGCPMATATLKGVIDPDFPYQTGNIGRFLW